MQSFINYLLQFTEVPESSLHALLKLFKPIHLKKNELYARSGQEARKLAFIESGLMRAYYQNHEGEEFNKIFFTTPSIVGAYTSLITKEKNNINIECLTDCGLLDADFQSILDLYEEHPKIERLNRTMAEDFFVKKEKREISLVMNDASERYALFQKEHPGLENQITQYQVASYLGITPTQLSRIRAKKQ
ncbi:Crp/Fnr family transcriptional regulator [Fulvivirga sp. M361]|uniref:Crp/Fnr family transcriptional regulator n=1 Tax=Fulvivirga sp. M361 TaxID=2594266 RepID=UPI00117A6133|nr:Crp/Fnr family transcriptional regulator [Fulvivirga sp. M361]TRX62565.1 Crp/Fnr family transcriptional regulator [Fulvivirga sp. M361]